MFLIFRIRQSTFKEKLSFFNEAFQMAVSSRTPVNADGRMQGPPCGLLPPQDSLTEPPCRPAPARYKSSNIKTVRKIGGQFRKRIFFAKLDLALFVILFPQNFLGFIHPNTHFEKVFLNFVIFHKHLRTN